MSQFIEEEGDEFICWTQNSADKTNLETTFLGLGAGPTQRSVKEVKPEMVTIALWENCQALRLSDYGNDSGNLLEFSPISTISHHTEENVFPAEYSADM